jgi:hypothetical protein
MLFGRDLLPASPQLLPFVTSSGKNLELAEIRIRERLKRYSFHANAIFLLSWSCFIYQEGF